jgi:hypothetical protein
MMGSAIPPVDFPLTQGSGLWIELKTLDSAALRWLAAGPLFISIQ